MRAAEARRSRVRVRRLESDQTASAQHAVASRLGDGPQRSLGNDAELLADLLEDLQNPVEMLVSRASPCSWSGASPCRGDTRADERIDEHAGVEERAPEDEGIRVVADDDGDDGGLRLDDVEAQSLNPLRILSALAISL